MNYTIHELHKAVEQLIEEYGENRSLINVKNNLIHRIRYVITVLLLLTAISATAGQWDIRYRAGSGWCVTCNDSLQWRAVEILDEGDSILCSYGVGDYDPGFTYCFAAKYGTHPRIIYDNRYITDDGIARVNNLKPSVYLERYYDDSFVLRINNSSQYDMLIDGYAAECVTDGDIQSQVTRNLTIPSGSSRQIFVPYRGTLYSNKEYRVILMWRLNGQPQDRLITIDTSSCPAYVDTRYDVNGDGKVDVADVTALVQYINSQK